MVDQVGQANVLQNVQLYANTAAQTSRAGEATAQVIQDPSAIIADLAEELGFLAAEKTADEIDESEEDKYASFREFLVVKSVEAIDGEDNDLEQQVQTALVRLRGRQARDFQDLYSLLGDIAGGTPRQLALLKKVLETEEGAQLLANLDDPLNQFAADNESSLVAAINVHDVLINSPNIASSEAERILDLYEGTIIGAKSVLQVFQKIGQQEGQEKVTDWRDYLTEAVASDLKGQPSGADREKLQVLLTELKGFRIFNTLASGLDDVAARYFTPNKVEVVASEFVQQTLDYVEQPIREYPKIQKLGGQLIPDRSVLFFQDFRGLLKSLPDYAYVSEQQKAQILVPLQQTIDDITYSEFEE